MRMTLLSCAAALLIGFTCANKPTHPQRFVFDNAALLSADQELQLDTLLRGHELRTTNEIAVVTITSYQGYPDLRSFAATCGDSLGVGKKKKNNGVVIVLSKELREVFIATGLGTENVMPDARCQRIIDSLMIPLFKEDMYFDGLWEGSKGVVRYLELPGHEVK
jgi:uncharacterized protein